jgi:hypothetical protein
MKPQEELPHSFAIECLLPGLTNLGNLCAARLEVFGTFFVDEHVRISLEDDINATFPNCVSPLLYPERLSWRDFHAIKEQVSKPAEPQISIQSSRITEERILNSRDCLSELHFRSSASRGHSIGSHQLRFAYDRY